MNRYFCYQLWGFLEPDFSEMSFENDKEALGFWLDLSEKHELTNCFTITRLHEVNGVFYEDFLAMFRRNKHGLQMIKSHAL